MKPVEAVHAYLMDHSPALVSRLTFKGPAGWVALSAALLVWLGIGVLEPLPWETIAVGAVIWLALGAVGLAVLRRTGEDLTRTQDGKLEQRLVLLAERQHGSLRAQDAVRELGMSFDQAEALLNRLCARGHATLEFDPRSDGPRYRLN